MMLEAKKPRHGQLNSMDRISDLPDSIIHHIISFLGTDEACRTSILSKRWVRIWSTGLNLDFKPHFFISKKDAEFTDKYHVRKNTPLYKLETIDRLLDFIETTMRRYAEENLSIRKLVSEFPTIDKEMGTRIDEWLGIAVKNQVESLSLSVTYEDSPSYYTLPVILFSAKSMISLKCCRVSVPHCQGLNLKLTLLQSLDLTEAGVDEHTLQEIIMSCPLKSLKLCKCSGINSLSIPSQCSRLEYLNVALSVPTGGKLLVDTSSLLDFSYHGSGGNDSWLFNLTRATTRNLRILTMFAVTITVDAFNKLVSELLSIRIMTFFDCTMPKSVRVVSKTLHELGFNDCCDLVKIAVLDAPELDILCYTGDLHLSSVITSHNKRNGYIHLTLESIEARDFVRIKRLLSRSNCCRVLSVILFNDLTEVEFDKDQLGKLCDGLPYHIQELRLSLTCSETSDQPVSSLMAFIDGLFGICRPDMLCLPITLELDNTIVQSLLEILKNKTLCWRDPLKRIEIDSTTDCSSLIRSSDIELRVRLYW